VSLATALSPMWGSIMTVGNHAVSIDACVAPVLTWGDIRLVTMATRSRQPVTKARDRRTICIGTHGIIRARGRGRVFLAAVARMSARTNRTVKAVTCSVAAGTMTSSDEAADLVMFGVGDRGHLTGSAATF
jgi:hypothetical protein